MEKVTTKLEQGTVLEIDAGVYRIRVMYMTTGINVEIYNHDLKLLEADLTVH